MRREVKESPHFQVNASKHERQGGGVTFIGAWLIEESESGAPVPLLLGGYGETSAVTARNL